MRRNEKYRQICLSNGYPTDIDGKIVKRVGFSTKSPSNGGYSQLTIMFTDNTYVSFEISEKNEECDDSYEIINNCFSRFDPNYVNDGELDCWEGTDGKIHFYDYVQKLIDLGIWEVEEDEIIKLKEKRKQEQEKRDYETYLRLKKRFETKQPVIEGSLRQVVDKMNEEYPGKIGDMFNLGIDKRVVPVHSDGAIIGWKIQQLVGDIWVDVCDETFNTMKEFIENYRTKGEKEIETCA